MAVVVGTVVAVGVAGAAEQVTRVAVADLGKMADLVATVATVVVVAMAAMAATLVLLVGAQVAGTSNFASSRLKRSCLFSVKVTLARALVEGGLMAVPWALVAAAVVEAAAAAAAAAAVAGTGIRAAVVAPRGIRVAAAGTGSQDKRGHWVPKLRTGRKGQ
jgi:hypothetical protein